MIPAFALLLMLPPLLNLFRVERLLLGMPLEVVYLFAIWTALVAGAALLSRAMPRQPEVRPDAAPAPAATDAPDPG